jgi:hypothetical protein
MTRGSNDWRCLLSCAGLLAAGLGLSSCAATAPSAGGPAEGGGTGGFAGLFASAPVVAGPAATGTAAFNPDDCPAVEIRTGTASLMVSDKAADGAAGDVRYQLALNQLARQCTLLDGNLVMRIGVQGRIILGPAGAPGEVDVPLRFAVIKESLAPKTIATKFKRVGAQVPSGQDNVIFSDVDDALSFPMPSRAELATYRVYVGFDELGDAAEKKPAAKKPAAKRKQ